MYTGALFKIPLADFVLLSRRKPGSENSTAKFTKVSRVYLEYSSYYIEITFLYTHAQNSIVEFLLQGKRCVNFLLEGCKGLCADNELAVQKEGWSPGDAVA